MHFSRISTILLVAIGGVSADGSSQGHDGHGSPPSSIVSQANQCGNGATPYCCNNEVKFGGAADCKAIDQSGICDTTIVCCNANESIQQCTGNVAVQGGSPSGDGSSSSPSSTGAPKGGSSSSGTGAQIVSQANMCGNGITPYCCNNEALHGGEANCRAMDQSGICSTTIVCCNANDSIQVCVGDLVINNPPPPAKTTTTAAPPTSTSHGHGSRTTAPPTSSKPHSSKPPATTSAIASVVQQTNQCGNDVTVYCCNNDALKGGSADCTAIGQGSICDTTIVCCNANHSIQVCIGNIIINNPTVTATAVVTETIATTVEVPTTISGRPTTIKVPTTIEVPTTVTRGGKTVVNTVTKVETVPVPTTVEVVTTVRGKPTTIEVPTTIIKTVPVESVKTIVETKTVEIATTIKGVPTTIEVPTTVTQVVIQTSGVPVTVVPPPLPPVQSTKPPAPPVQPTSVAPAPPAPPASHTSVAPAPPQSSTPVFTGGASRSEAIDGRAIAGLLAFVAFINIHL